MVSGSPSAACCHSNAGNSESPAGSAAHQGGVRSRPGQVFLQVWPLGHLPQDHMGGLFGENTLLGLLCAGCHWSVPLSLAAFPQLLWLDLKD